MHDQLEYIIFTIHTDYIFVHFVHVDLPGKILLLDCCSTGQLSEGLLALPLQVEPLYTIHDGLIECYVNNSIRLQYNIIYRFITVNANYHKFNILLTVSIFI